MTRGYEPDPEVLADLALRARTERERPRTESQVATMLSWTKPEIVGVWRCRTCGSPSVPISADDLAFAASWNAVLRRRGEPPLDPERIAFCDDCREAHRAKAVERRREKTDRIAEEVRNLKAAADPTLEEQTIRTLRDLGHPDVDGLVKALETRLTSSRSSRKGRASL